VGTVKYFVTIGTQTIEVEVDGPRVLVGGEPLETDLAAVSGTPLYHLLLGGESWTVAAEPLEGVGRWALGIAGERVEVAVQDDRSREIAPVSAKGQPAPGGGTVRAPMPGLVVRIEVAEGQQVDAGAGLVVVEAMKMENELRAPRSGMVQTVHVAVGQAVEKGASLVTLASPEPSG
jgi:biotin carboxyl carrier protein